MRVVCYLMQSHMLVTFDSLFLSLFLSLSLSLSPNLSFYLSFYLSTAHIITMMMTCSPSPFSLYFYLSFYISFYSMSLYLSFALSLSLYLFWCLCITVPRYYNDGMLTLLLWVSLSPSLSTSSYLSSFGVFLSLTSFSSCLFLAFLKLNCWQ